MKIDTGREAVEVVGIAPRQVVRKIGIEMNRRERLEPSLPSRAHRVLRHVPIEERLRDRRKLRDVEPSGITRYVKS